MNMSAFRPVDSSLYEVCSQFITERVVNKTPTPNADREKCTQSPKFVKVISSKQRKNKRFWSPEEKTFAINKAKQIGLARAARVLQNEYSSVYGDLSPSTLQYWSQRDREGTLKN
ncbi:hypothetical protein EIN_252780 [Entamoeba invadens IP1]|uniref:Uncharacterized protein n=1 Tax=Entamoeba invadens IP1 TaxID=370355 RepID=A0A0A1UGP5_ENTIV|nr:hypothetical protein EIN_252780 [Entamoeba invadens IP1]ELP95034.1 hypothetical protein EIN_252780 [Entamoeba invadens IP1]|eukprot:XP_004261805.1 hypothetical protein EIN_252780 [Entamoeba invadens IP1]